MLLSLILIQHEKNDQNVLAKKNGLEVISSLNMCSCPINILEFWYYRRNIKDG